MRRVDYDAVSGDYGRRYERHGYAGVERTVLDFATSAPDAALLEVGCGTGHWLALLRGRRRTAAVDRSRGMLERARLAAPDLQLVQARAEQLPFGAACFDRLLCVNALHHFDDRPAFLAEAHRLLRPGGEILVVGLDPHTGRDRWWVYDFFPTALAADRARYPSAPAVRRMMTEAGFVDARTRECQHMVDTVTVRAAAERGLLERSSTSQLLVIDDDAWREGLARVLAATGEPTLSADLRLYATTASRR